MLAKIKNAISPEKANLQKAKITYESNSGLNSIECQFNPSTLTISKSVGWHPISQVESDMDTQPDLNAPEMIFGGGNPAEFSLDLIFDTTTLDNQDVRGYTNQLLQLTLMGGGDPDASEDDDPPDVQFIWGEFMLFEAVIKNVQINYTLFLPSGTPVRARAHVQFVQAYDSDAPEEAQNPTTRTDPRKTYRVQQGDRLDLLAYREYGRSDRWREIAEANNLEDPLSIQPGQILIIPPASR